MPAAGEVPFGEVVDALPDGLVVAERSGRVRYANAAAARLLVGLPHARGAPRRPAGPEPVLHVRTVGGEPLPRASRPTGGRLEDDAAVLVLRRAVA
jgi:PAS fold